MPAYDAHVARLAMRAKRLARNRLGLADATGDALGDDAA